MWIERRFELEQGSRFGRRHRPVRLDHQIGELKESMACPVGIIKSILAVVFFEIGDNNRRAVYALRNVRIERLRRGKRKCILFTLEIEPATNCFKVTLLLLYCAVADVY